MFRTLPIIIVAGLMAVPIGCAYDDDEYAANNRQNQGDTVALGSTGERYAYAQDATQPRQERRESGRAGDVESTIANWPDVSKKAARPWLRSTASRRA